ncbi:MAG: hypothetical protein AAB405_01335 [Patescibacteria group bacterium]
MAKKKDKIQEIIERSGNDLQFRIVNYLESHKWEVSISPYYNDPSTGKPREIDIVAILKWSIKDDFGHFKLGELAIRLFVECKYIKDDVIFWFRQKNMLSAIKLAKDNNILCDKQDCYLNQNKVSQHHYIDNVQVAKIAAKSYNRDDIFEAMNQCLNGLIFFGNNSNISTSYHIDFPLIVTNSFKNIHKRDQNNGYVQITEPFQLEVDYSYKQTRSDGRITDVTKYFLIDIMSFDKLDSFLQDLENRDIKLFRDNLQWDLERQERQNREQLNNNSHDPYY